MTATGVDERSVHHDYRELCARPDVDVVVIASPNHWHHVQTMEALRNGKDVYLEKPMTYTMEEAQELVEAVKASGRVLQVGSQCLSMDHCHKAESQSGKASSATWSGPQATSAAIATSSASGTTPSIPMHREDLDWEACLGTAPKRPSIPTVISAVANARTTRAVA